MCVRLMFFDDSERRPNLYFVTCGVVEKIAYLHTMTASIDFQTRTAYDQAKQIQKNV